jgi:probable F420-dependent oxidoreductase
MLLYRPCNLPSCTSCFTCCRCSQALANTIDQGDTMAPARPFRFGVLCESARTPQDLLTTARKAEDAGYATFLIRDHLIDTPFAHQFAPITSLATVATTTRTLRVGNMVLSNDYRPPVLLAKELATLDTLSGGRVEVGLGAGFLEAEYEPARIPYERPGIRVDRLEEALQVYKLLLSQGRATFHGSHYELTDFDNFPKPIQQPHPPIMVAGGGKRMLTLAGREADIVGLMGVSTDGGIVTRDSARRSAPGVAQQVEWVRQGAGSRFDEVELSAVVTPIVTAEMESARQDAAEQYAREQGWPHVTAEQILEMPSVAIGSRKQIAETLEARREQFAISYYVLSDRHAEAFAPVVARLRGC